MGDRKASGDIEEDYHLPDAALCVSMSVLGESES